MPRNKQATAVQCVKKIWDVYEDNDSINKPVKRYVSLEWPVVPDHKQTDSTSPRDSRVLESTLPQADQEAMSIRVGDHEFRISRWIYETRRYQKRYMQPTTTTAVGVANGTFESNTRVLGDRLRRVRLVRMSEEKEYRRKHEKSPTFTGFQSSFSSCHSSPTNPPAHYPRADQTNSPMHSCSNTPNPSLSNSPTDSPIITPPNSPSPSPIPPHQHSAIVPESSPTHSTTSTAGSSTPSQSQTISRLGRWSDKLLSGIQKTQKPATCNPEEDEAVFYERQLIKDLKGFPRCSMPTWFPRLCGCYLRQPEFTLTVVGYDQGFPQVVVYGERVNHIGELLNSDYSPTTSPSSSANSQSDLVNNVQWFRYWRTPQLQREHLVQTRRELLQNHRRSLTSITSQSSIVDNHSRAGKLTYACATSNLMARVLRAFSTDHAYSMKTPATTDAEIVTKTTDCNSSGVPLVTNTPLLTPKQLSRIDFSTPRACRKTLRIPRPPPLPITVCNTPITAPQQSHPRHTAIGCVQSESLRDITIMVDRDVVDFDRAPFQRRETPRGDRVAETRILLNAGDVY